MLPVIRWVLSELYPAEIDANSSAVSPANTGRTIDFLRAGFRKNRTIPLLTGVQTGWITGTSEAPRKQEENEMRQRRHHMKFALALLCLSLAACGFNGGITGTD